MPDASSPLLGSCLCGGVRYRVTGPLSLIARCHCDQCRKASGAEFATNATVAVADFEILSGQDLLREYAWRAGQARAFCGRCGSPILKRVGEAPEHVRIRLGCLDGEIDQKPAGHVFVSEKPAWSEISDDLPQFDTLPRPPD